jgi:hypothetical protein
MADLRIALDENTVILQANKVFAPVVPCIVFAAGWSQSLKIRSVDRPPIFAEFDPPLGRQFSNSNERGFCALCED